MYVSCLEREENPELLTSLKVLDKGQNKVLKKKQAFCCALLPSADSSLELQGKGFTLLIVLTSPTAGESRGVLFSKSTTKKDSK